VEIPDLPGPKEFSGSGAIATEKFISLIPTRERILRTIESTRFVTAVTWLDGEFWHATRESDETTGKMVTIGEQICVSRADASAFSCGAVPLRCDGRS
jgi:hypothetical protein